MRDWVFGLWVGIGVFLGVVAFYLFLVYCVRLSDVSNENLRCSKSGGYATQSPWTLGAGKVTCHIGRSHE